MSFEITRHIVGLLIKPWRGKCSGLENIPKGGAVLCANHASYLDHFIIGLNLLKKERAARFLAKKEHFEGFIQTQWHKYLNAIPLDRKKGGKRALQIAVKALKKGDLIMIYPEGTRTTTGKMNKAKTGVVRLALAAHVPIVPMGVSNTFKILPKGKKIPRLGLKADLRIGKPINLSPYYGKENNKKILRKLTTKVMKKIAALAKQRYEFN
ncbi:MAG TPA: lysophospholipid acyltransferase family protein [Candidatus Nanoarchaeia archaeon]|nr:lysophospholipid acyltransferase family protein [Candidatus Nanoarchaeia archaeon]